MTPKLPSPDPDWAKSDVEIAKSLGISRQAVNHMRRKVGAPPPPKRPKKLTQCDALGECFAVLDQLAQWNELGIDEYLPSWAQESWGELESRVDSLLSRWPNR